jgi:hypothetical protein
MAAIVLAAVLMPMRAITNISILTFSVTGRGPAIAAQMAIQSLVVFLSTLAALFEFTMGGSRFSLARSVASSPQCALVSSRWDVATYCHFHHATGSAAPPSARRPRQRLGWWMGRAVLVKMRYSRAQSVCTPLAF